ncbi:hypothetical protein C5F50_10305 [Nitrosopumilus ureiphilus]|uniref:Uncharacterized protein n=1 Tax=Nitrosopumilus ureiphilus TaxID=1470067 RepID=A0A7D5M651_9ARCH|nr:hypothetical protein C5F50_10305 [Nitrosopumilus ureiphilus]
MTSEIDILRKAIEKYDDAIRLKKLNENLYEHLIGSLYYLVKHSEKFGTVLPKKGELIRMLEKADYLIDQFDKSDPTDFDSEKNRRRFDRISKQVLLPLRLKLLVLPVGWYNSFIKLGFIQSHLFGYFTYPIFHRNTIFCFTSRTMITRFNRYSVFISKSNLIPNKLTFFTVTSHVID